MFLPNVAKPGVLFQLFQDLARSVFALPADVEGQSPSSTRFRLKPLSFCPLLLAKLPEIHAGFFSHDRELDRVVRRTLEGPIANMQRKQMLFARMTITR